MNHLDLFAGIGGFGLAAKWAGWNTRAWVEIDPFCQKVLKHHFPQASGFSDIKKFDYASFKSALRKKGEGDRAIDVISGGFPCQPYSLSGKRLGKEDSRHLWPQMLRAIREFHPRWIVGENVFGITNWQNGLVFEEVCAEMEKEGYSVQPYIIPACSINAPHRRDRVWFIAHSTSHRRAGKWTKIEIKNRKKRSEQAWELEGGFKRFCIHGDASNPNSSGLRKEANWIGEAKQPYQNRKEYKWEDFPTQSPVCSRNDGLSYGLDTFTIQRRANTRILTTEEAFGKWKSESLKGFGNAVVPQLVFRFFDLINQYEILESLDLSKENS